MITPFRVFEEEIFPQLHSIITQELTSDGFSQKDIAECLGITQAMVSKYNIKTHLKNPILHKLAEKVIADTKNRLPKEKICLHLTQQCFSLIQSGELCGICSKKNNLKNCNSCMNLNLEDERKNVIENLKEAITILEKNNPIELMPNVMINIAMKLDNANSEADVASFPGRIIKINNNVKAVNPPEFNSSKHLANKLLTNKKYKAVINIKYDEKIKKQIQNIEDIEIDKGGFGIEPCVYVYGKDAVDVVNKVIKIK